MGEQSRSEEEPIVSKSVTPETKKDPESFGVQEPVEAMPSEAKEKSPELPKSAIESIGETQFRQIMAIAVPVIEKAISTIDLSKIDKYESSFSEHKTPDAEDGTSGKEQDFIKMDIPIEYYDLRKSGFSAEDIKEIVTGAGSGNLEITLSLFSRIENEAISTMLARPENQQKIHGADSAIKDFFAENGVELSKNDLPRTVFTGKFQRMILQSCREKGFYPQHIEAGQYYPDIDVSVVNLPERIIREGFSDHAVDVYVHEKFHSISASIYETKEDTTILDARSSKRMKSGFMSVAPGAKRQDILGALNEGVTDYFTHLITKKMGLKIDWDQAYEYFERDISALVDFMSQSQEGATAEEKKAKEQAELLKKYISRAGTISLGREMDDKIGRKSLAIFEICIGREEEGLDRFLQLVGEQRENGITEETFKISKKRIDEFRIKKDQLKKEYPFISVGEWDHSEYDENYIPISKWKEAA